MSLHIPVSLHLDIYSYYTLPSVCHSSFLPFCFASHVPTFVLPPSCPVPLSAVWSNSQPYPLVYTLTPIYFLIFSLCLYSPIYPPRPWLHAFPSTYLQYVPTCPVSLSILLYVIAVSVTSLLHSPSHTIFLHPPTIISLPILVLFNQPCPFLPIAYSPSVY